MIVKKDKQPEFRQFDCVEHPNVPCMFYAQNMRKFGM